MRNIFLLAAGLCLPLPSMAADASYLDALYTFSANLEISDPGPGSEKFDGRGYGLRGVAALSDSLVLTGEYQSISYDGATEDSKQTRLGVGLTGATPSGLYLEYIRLDTGGTPINGYGVHARFESNESPSRLYAQVGYINLNGPTENVKGLEYLVGLTFPVFGSTSGFIDYRKNSLKGADSKMEFDVADLRAGVRFSF